LPKKHISFDIIANTNRRKATYWEISRFELLQSIKRLAGRPQHCSCLKYLARELSCHSATQDDVIIGQLYGLHLQQFKKYCLCRNVPAELSYSSTKISFAFPQFNWSRLTA
jgi:hypothetical protein